MHRFECLAGGRSGRSQKTKSAKQAAVQEARTTVAAPVEFAGLKKKTAPAGGPRPDFEME
jgi:hypothetical protein